MPDERDEDEASDENAEGSEEDSYEEEDEEKSESHWYDQPATEQEPATPDPCELVTIASFASPPEAEMARLVLDDAGIPAFLEGLETESALRIWIGDIKLQVRRSDSSAALAVLAEKEQTAQSETEAEDTDTTTCLSCGQPIPDEATACPACGWSYADDQETQFRADT